MGSKLRGTPPLQLKVARIQGVSVLGFRCSAHEQVFGLAGLRDTFVQAVVESRGCGLPLPQSGRTFREILFAGTAWVAVDGLSPSRKRFQCFSNRSYRISSSSHWLLIAAKPLPR